MEPKRRNHNLFKVQRSN